jgi:hypothetical protein
MATEKAARAGRSSRIDRIRHAKFTVHDAAESLARRKGLLRRADDIAAHEREHNSTGRRQYVRQLISEEFRCRCENVRQPIA